MTNYDLPFNLKPFEELDNFALLSCQKYNLGNDTDWFGAFRGGLYGFYARIYGVISHYQSVHSWMARPRLPTETEFHLASIFFNMDSAIECLTFALNGLGYAALPGEFRDVTDRNALRFISPQDILGHPRSKSPRSLLTGYSRIFPTLQDLWQSQNKLLAAVFEQHDVSKHRQTIYSGGMARLDPPPGFYEALGIKGDTAKEALFWPSAEIILRDDPKAPPHERSSQPQSQLDLLEDVAEKYCALINESGELSCADARANIQLEYAELQENIEQV